MVLYDEYCKIMYCGNCGNQYTNKDNANQQWCKPCQMNNLKHFSNWFSGMGEFNALVQEMRSKINCYDDIIFEWIPYNHFNSVEKIGEVGFVTVYSAVWASGPLNYDKNKYGYTRNKDKKVALKCLYNSQNITDEFLSEVRNLSMNL